MAGEAPSEVKTGPALFNNALARIWQMIATKHEQAAQLGTGRRLDRNFSADWRLGNEEG